MPAVAVRAAMRATGVAGVTMALCAGVAPVAASIRVSARGPFGFATTAGDVRCGYRPRVRRTPARLLCVVARTTRGVPVAATLTPTGMARLFRPGAADTPPVPRIGLHRGVSLVVGPFHCTNSDGAMVCISDRSPYGFALSRGEQSPLAAALPTAGVGGAAPRRY